jgi:DNA modification methylase
VAEAWTLNLGDCLGEGGLATLADRSVDHVICDPPYDEHTHGMQRRGATGRDRRFGLGHSTISMERHVGFAAITGEQMDKCAEQFARLAQRWVLVFCALEQQAAWADALECAGLEHVRFGLWHKPGSTPQFSGDRPGTAAEAIEIAHQPGRKRWNGGGGFGLWTEPIVKTQCGDRVHPTQKPISLMDALVRDFSDPGDLICDPFAGSGTTLLAAVRTGRRAVGWEKDPGYYETARKRLGAARQQFELLPRGPKPKQSKFALDPEEAA